MARLIVQHTTQDYDHWRTVYDEHQPTRASYNLTDVGVYQNADNNNDVCVIVEGDMDDLQAFANDPELKAAMQRAGVTTPPTFTFGPDIQATA